MGGSEIFKRTSSEMCFNTQMLEKYLKILNKSIDKNIQISIVRGGISIEGLKDFLLCFTRATSDQMGMLR